MWSPADLFTPALGIFLSPLKRGISYFYQHLGVLALTLVGIAMLITLLTMLQNRRARGA